LCGADTWTLWKVDGQYLENFEVWCWKRMEISWTDRVKIKEVLHIAKEHRSVLHAYNKTKEG
jgi:hypothetical protein